VPEEVKERYLSVRERSTGRLVTVIELLSPTNKKTGSYDRTIYLSKRNEVILSGVNLVEIDLLRGGKRLPAEEPLPAGDYYAIVCRSFERPRAHAYAWTLRQPLPTVSIPLAEGDSDVPLDLQAAFSTVYDHAGYDYSLSYDQDVDPPLSESDATWVQNVLGPS
jgi:hypothetical protein